MTSLADNGPGTLRQAIADAAPGDTIDFAVAGTITLSSGELSITKDLTIEGPGATSLNLDAGANSRIFNVTATDATIAGLTITGGRAFSGGGILNNNNSTLTINEALFTGNSSTPGPGAAIANNGTLIVTKSRIIGNSTINRAGGIQNNGTLSVTDSTIDNNSSGQGGGIENFGSVTLTRTTVSNNRSTMRGGGVYQSGGELHLVNTTFSGNDGPWCGGGVCMFAATVTIRASTFTGNTSNSGGGISVLEGPAPTVSNTIISGNSAISNGPDCYGTIMSSGYNLIGDNTDCTVVGGSGDLIGTPAAPIDALLGPLQDNGGPTFTHALLEGSSAIDHIPLGVNGCGDPGETDQRGVTRPRGAGCDIGAYEEENTPLSTPFALDTRNFADSTLPFTVQTRGPDVLVNTGITDSGGTDFVLTTAMLKVTGGSDGMDEITFTVLSAPVHGTLFRDGAALADGATFTQADVDSGLVSYQRGAGDPLSDTFELGAADEDDFELLEGSLRFLVAGLSSATGAVFLVDSRNFEDSAPPFTVETRAPDVLANTGITDSGGADFPITMAMLKLSGGSDGLDEITFTLVNSPVHGSLLRDGAALAGGSTFTQADIDAGLISYQRAPGAALSDSFELSAVDEGSFGLLEGSIFFTVAGLAGGSGPVFVVDSRNFADSAPPFPLETRAPDVLANTGITDSGGTDFAITMAMLKVTGGGDGMDEITFTLLSAPVHGTLLRDGAALPAGAMFTQADIDGGLITYQRDAGAALSDTFELGAVDESSFGLLEGSIFFTVAGMGSAAGPLFLVDTRNFDEFGTFAVHTSSVAVNVTDRAPGSLRQAIANTDSGGTTTLDAALDGQTIVLDSGPLIIDKTLAVDNSAVPGGVALSGNRSGSVLHVTTSGILTLDGMTLTEGKSTASGGAIRNDGDLTLKNVTVTNSASFLDGGGILNTATGSLELVNTTVAGNLALNFGGGIFNTGTVSAIHSTISDNEAFFLSGGGIFDSGGSVALENSIVAGNVAAMADNLNGPPDVATGNNLTAGNPLLAPLGDYGGPTLTMPPLPGSPAIEGAVLLASTPPTDQLGGPRPRGALPDLGSVEAIPVGGAGLASNDGDTIPDLLEGPGTAYSHLDPFVDDSGVDTDGDGSTDAEEIANMTNPLNGNDSFRLIEREPADGFDPATNPLVTVSFSTFPGLQYELETSDNLVDFQPVPGSLFTADDFSATFEVLLKPGGRDFVRATRK